MEERQSLKKVLGRTDVLALALGTMIGWGVIMLAGEWVDSAGLAGGIVAFLVGAGICVLVGLTYAELTAALPVAGGELVFAYRAAGYNFSWFTGWTVALAYIGVAGWEGIAIATAVDYLFPLSKAVTLHSIGGTSVSLIWALVGGICSLLLSFLNHFGARPAAIFQVMATSAIALAGFLFFFGGITYGSPENIGVPMTGTSGFAAVLIVVPSMLIGFDIIPQSAEEMNLPKREIAKVLVISIVIGAVWYVLMMIGIAFSAPEEIRGAAIVPMADSMVYAFGAQQFGDLFIIGGIFGILTSWNGFMLGATRMLFAMGRARMLPSVFGRLHKKYHTPTAAIWLVGILCAVTPMLGGQALLWLVNVSAFQGVLAYMTVAISFLILRKKEPELTRPFNIKGGVLVGSLAVLALTVFLLMFLFSPSISLKWPQEGFMIIGWYALGGGLLFLARRKHNQMSYTQREIHMFGEAYARTMEPNKSEKVSER